jgi:hypothetical protein
MSTILLIYIDNTVDNCQQYCRHMSATKNNKAIVKLKPLFKTYASRRFYFAYQVRSSQHH